MKPILRHDLKVVPSLTGDLVRVEDPLTSACYEFTASQWDAAQKLSEHRSLESWLSVLLVDSIDQTRDRQGWILFLQRLAQAGLLQGLATPPSPPAPKFFDPLAFRLGSLPTQPWLPLLERALRPWTQTYGLLAIAIATVLSYLMLLGQWPRLFEEGIHFSENISPWSLLLLAPTMMLAKTLHELGHAITAERMGARSREIGLMAFFGAPCLYADVSSVSLLPRKKDRLAVTMAGSCVDLVSGAIAGWIWSVTDSGTLHELAWLTVTVIVGSNLLFNLNPLMKFDGYFLLSDLLEIPNLHVRAQRAWALRRRRGWWHRENSQTSSEDSVWLALFAMASMAYRLFVLFAIAVAAIASASSVGLGWAMTAALALLLLRRYVAVGRVGKRRPMSVPRLAPRVLRWSLAASILLLAAMTPWSGRVTGEGSIHRANAVPLYAFESGLLIESRPDGAWIAAGDSWLSLSSPEIESELRESEARCDELQKRIDSFRRLGSDESGESLSTLEEKLLAAQTKLNSLQRRAQSLTPSAPAEGRLVTALRPTPDPTEKSETEPPVDWCGDPLHPSNRGAWIESGSLLAWVVPHQGAWEALVAIDESEVAQVQIGDRASIRTRSGGQLTFEAKVVRIGSEASEMVSTHWSQWLGNLVQGQTSKRRSAWLLLRAEESEASSDRTPWIHDEPVRVSIRTTPESLLSRSWRWWRTQVYFPW